MSPTNLLVFYIGLLVLPIPSFADRSLTNGFMQQLHKPAYEPAREPAPPTVGGFEQQLHKPSHGPAREPAPPVISGFGHLHKPSHGPAREPAPPVTDRSSSNGFGQQLHKPSHGPALEPAPPITDQSSKDVFGQDLHKPAHEPTPAPTPTHRCLKHLSSPDLKHNPCYRPDAPPPKHNGPRANSD